jgi:hypothetical protein
MNDPIPVRVTVLDAWDEVTLRLADNTPIRDVKRLALDALRVKRPADEYVVKFRGAAVPEDETTLADIQFVPNAGLIMLGRRRRPVF